jgi:hypothetical protein
MARPPEPEGTPGGVREIVPDVYCLGSRGRTQTDVYFVRSGSSWALVDAGWAKDGPSIKRAAESLYVLAFIELGSRRIHLNVSTAHPDSAWVTQHARNLTVNLDDRSLAVRFLIRDRDTKFSRSFDQVIRSEGARVIVTPIQAPNANAHAERVIETIRAECLDWTLILGRRQLDPTLRIYAEHYNRQSPAAAAPSADAGAAGARPPFHRVDHLRLRGDGEPGSTGARTALGSFVCRRSHVTGAAGPDSGY